MSVTSAMYTGVTGLLNNGEAINVIGNNISNVNTIGFKGSRMLFSDMLSSSIGNNSQIGRGVQIQKVDNLFSQASLQTSTNTTDIALQGDGFFALTGPNAANGTAVAATDAYYTRAGAFRVDSNNVMVNPDNYKVLGSDRIPVNFPATYTPAGGVALNFQKVSGIDSKGMISVLYADATGNSATAYYTGNGSVGAAATVGVGLATVPNAGGLLKQGGTLFTQTGTALGGSGTPTIAAANGTNQKMLSNNLEISNVDMATEFVTMITTQRAYSANSKTITTADEMTQEVLNLKR